MTGAKSSAPTRRAPFTELGFLYSNGTWTTLSDPSAAPGGLTVPASINDRGQVTGFYFNGTTDVGFLYSNGIWTTLSDPSPTAGGYTVPASINDRGQVTGTLTEEGFLYSNGTWTTLSDPSAGAKGFTRPASINDKGQVTGYYFNGTTYVGFVYSNGIWTNLSDPSAAPGKSTVALSINDKGQVTGYYYDGTTYQGFIATPSDVDHKREPPTLTITDHSLSLSAGGTIPLPISVSPYDADDTVTVKISGVPSFDTITAGDGHAVAKKGNSYTFTAADVQSGLTLHSSFDRQDHPDHDHHEHDRDEGEHSERRLAAEQSKLTVTAFNTTHGEYAAAPPQTITVTNTPPTYTFNALNDPSGTSTTSTAINASGQVIGNFRDNSGVIRGFLYSDGKYTTIDPSGSTETLLKGINDFGQVVGAYFLGSTGHSFLYSGGIYTTLNDPSGTRTIATAINDAGQIVGQYRRYERTFWAWFPLQRRHLYHPR